MFAETFHKTLLEFLTFSIVIQRKAALVWRSSALMTGVRVFDGRMDAAQWKPDLELDDFADEDFFQSEVSDSFATPPKYVTAIGRGSRKRPDPCNIRLPRTYFDMLRQKHNSRRPAGRGSALRSFSGQNLEILHRQDSAQMVNQPGTIPSSSLSENFLGAATRGLTSEILEGKACLMEKFLGKPMAGSDRFNPFGGEHQRSTGSLRSTRTAPVLDLDCREQWPGVGVGACQSDSGRGGPSKSYSLQDALNAISSVPAKWDSGSLQSSQKWRRMKKRQGSSQETGASCPEKEGAAASSTSGSSHPENRIKEKNPASDVPRSRQDRDGAMPGGPNLIQVECLPEDITEQRLESVMYSFGAVIGCEILRDSDSQNCIGIAFVRFETSEACLSAISALHGEDSPFHDSSDGNEIPKLLIHMMS